MESWHTEYQLLAFFIWGAILLESGSRGAHWFSTHVVFIAWVSIGTIAFFVFPPTAPLYMWSVLADRMCVAIFAAATMLSGKASRQTGKWLYLLLPIILGVLMLVVSEIVALATVGLPVTG
jgi:hypothetical protein